MAVLGGLFRTAVAQKAVMAITGIVLFGFVLVHMLGNLKLYMGAESYNAYAEFLRSAGYPALPHEGMLWIARVVLLACVVLHMWAALSLTLMNRRARPIGYLQQHAVARSFASRTMRWGGVLIAAFVVYHLLHFTTGAAHPNFVPGDAYANVVSGFQVPWVSGFYILANLALGLHLYHGVWSLFQSLGWNHERYNPWRKRFAQVFAAVITLGNISFPVSVLAGLVKLS